MDCQNLLGDHRQHLKIDAVELVKAGPGPAGRQTLEELSEGDVIQTVGAVEDHALLGDGLGQILGGLGLASSGRTLRGTSKMKMEGAKQRSKGEKKPPRGYPQIAY